MRCGRYLGTLTTVVALEASSSMAAPQKVEASEVRSGTTSAAPSAADDGDTSLWDPSWRRVSPAEVVIGGALLTGTVATLLLVRLPESPRWTGGILMDDWFRDRLGAKTERGSLRAQTVSDVAYYSLVAYALVDPTIASLAHGWHVGGQVMGINLLAMSTAAFPLVALERMVGRERPGGDTDSFPSGHTGMAFASATLTCVHHSRMPLYGGGVPEIINCATALAAATTTGAARMVGNRHWSTDVAVGATVGIASGYLIPTLLHYDAEASRDETRSERAQPGLIFRGSPYPVLSRDTLGLGYVAAF